MLTPYTDFDAFWKNITPRQWAYRASQIMDEAKAMGIEASRVLVTTDETDEAYLYVLSLSLSTLRKFPSCGQQYQAHLKLMQ